MIKWRILNITNYMIFDEKTINNNFKFQVGKRYKINDCLCEGYEFFKNFIEIEFRTHIYLETRIYEVKVFDNIEDSYERHKTFDFKIKKEIDYKNNIDSERLQKEFLILKYHDDKIINEVLNSDFSYTYYSDIIETKIHKYLDVICSQFPLDNILENFFIKYATNKNIDVIVKKSTNIKTHIQILEFFGTKYYYQSYQTINKEYGDGFGIQRLNEKLIEQKSKKYIEHLIDDTIYHAKIVSTGIDEYLDYLIKESNDDNVMVEIAGIGRKKDLDYFIKNISKFEGDYKDKILTQIAHSGNDDYLDFPELIESTDYSVYNELFHHGRIKNLNEMKEHMEVSYLFDFDSVKFPW